MKFCSLASGSKANAIYVQSGSTRILVDCGLSLRELTLRFSQRGLNLNDLSAIIVTHEHEDHIKGVKALCSKFEIPLYVTEAVFKADPRLQEISLHQVFFFQANYYFEIGDISIEAFDVPHDAVQTVALRIWNSGKSFSILTDIGDYDSSIVDRVSGSNALLIEANHESDLLWSCPYPWSVKKRISGQRGHLANERTSQFIKDICKRNKSRGSLPEVLGAGHISDNSNTHQLAFKALEVGVFEFDNKPQIFVAEQKRATEIFSI